MEIPYSKPNHIRHIVNYQVTCYLNNMYDHRTNVLLDSNQYSILKKLSKESNKTLSELIREAIDNTYGINKKTPQELLDEINHIAKSAKLNASMEELSKWSKEGRM